MSTIVDVVLTIITIVIVGFAFNLFGTYFCK
jgi:hypothetical protein